MIRRDNLRLLSVGPGRIDYEPPEICFGSLSLTHQSFPAYLRAENGSGKSSLVLALAGAIPSAIWARVNIPFSMATDRREYSLKEAQESIRVIPQSWHHSSLGYDIRDELILSARGMPPWAQHISNQFELHQLGGRPPSRLSSGEKKRAIIGFALAANPVLAVSDEWPLHLDSHWKTVSRSLFAEFAEELGGTHLGLLNTADSEESGKEIPTNFFLPIKNEFSENKISPSLRRLASALQDLLATEEQLCTESFEVKVRYSPNHRRIRQVGGSAGELIEILGANGSGKTTFLKNIWLSSRLRWMKLFKPCLPPTCFLQTDPVYQVLGPTVADDLQRALRPTILHAAKEVIGRVASEKDVLTLSYGERKLLSLISAVASHYPILALDEPLSGLDCENKASAISLIDFSLRRGKCVLATSQESVFSEATHRIDLTMS